MTDAERLRRLMILARPDHRDEKAWQEWNAAIGDDPRAMWRCPDCCSLQGMQFCRMCGHDSEAGSAHASNRDPGRSDDSG